MKLSNVYLYDCKQRPTSTYKLNPIVDKAAANQYNCECSKSFTTKKGLSWHKNNFCKFPQSKVMKPNKLSKLGGMMLQESNHEEKKPKATRTGTVTMMPEESKEDDKKKPEVMTGTVMRKVPTKPNAKKRTTDKKAVSKKLQPAKKLKQIEAKMSD
jgi:hypothetical protein